MAPELWNETYTMKGIEFVEAAMATGFFFSFLCHNNTLIFANTNKKKTRTYTYLKKKLI